MIVFNYRLKYSPISLCNLILWTHLNGFLAAVQEVIACYDPPTE